ncbi:MAG: hypothetical protein IT176_05780 [Acidobacteria bacterium]|nr:hypothetical protein [Acidobacteriota bacterium]
MIPFDYITEWRAEAPWIDDAQVEQNLALKMRDGAFLADLSPLLATGEAWDPIAAEALISERLVTLLPGDPWKGDDH